MRNKLEQVAADAADSTVARCTVIRGEHHTAKLTFTPAQQCNIHYRKKITYFCLRILHAYYQKEPRLI